MARNPFIASSGIVIVYAIELNSFQPFVYAHSFDVIALTETWLTAKILDKDILPTGYCVYCSDRLFRGGGVMIGVSCKNSSRLIKSHSSIDMVTVELLVLPNPIIS